MISKDIATTIDGIYKAEMSVAGLPQNSGYQISFQEFNAMRPQIESLIGKSGLAVNLQNLNNAQELINNNIPVTEKTLKYKAMLDTLNLAGLSDADGQSRVLDKIADQMAIGGEASDTPLTNDPSIWENVKSAIVTLADASYDDIMNVISSGKAFTISSLKVVMECRQHYIRQTAGYVYRSGVNVSTEPAGYIYRSAEYICRPAGYVGTESADSIYGPARDVWTEQLCSDGQLWCISVQS